MLTLSINECWLTLKAKHQKQNVMGFVEAKADKKKYWKVSAGHLVQKCEAGDEGATPYVPTMGPNAGKTLYRLVRNGYNGKITRVSFRVSPNPMFGTEIEIEFDRNVVVACRASGSYLSRFAGICEQININEDVTVIPFSMPSEKDKTRNFTGWTWKQNGVKLVPPPEMTPNDPACTWPEPKKVRVSGRDVYDWTEREQHLMNLIADWAEAQGVYREVGGHQPKTESHDETNPWNEEAL